MAQKRGNSRRRRPPAGGKRRRRSSSRGGRQGALQSVLWFAGGLGIGLIILLPLLFFGGDKREAEPSAPEPRNRPESAPAAESPREDPEPAPEEDRPGGGDAETRASDPAREASGEGSEYRFYTLLPEMEVEVPEPEAEEDEPRRRDPAPRPDPEPQPRQPAESGSAPPEAAEDGRFLLQVASFQDPDQAERLKARLAIKGLQARVVRADLGGKGVWHRVRLGPYAGRADAREVRDRLAAAGMEAMILEK